MSLKLQSIYEDYSNTTNNFSKATELHLQFKELTEQYTALMLSSFTKEEIVTSMDMSNESYFSSDLIDYIEQAQASHQTQNIISSY